METSTDIIERYKKDAEEKIDKIFQQLPTMITRDQCKELCIVTLVGSLVGMSQVLENLTKHNRSSKKDCSCYNHRCNFCKDDVCKKIFNCVFRRCSPS